MEPSSSLTQSAYLCLHQLTGRLYTSRHVQFIETEFPYTKQAAVPSAVPEPTNPAYAPPTHVPISPLVQSVAPAPPCPDPHPSQVAEPSGHNSTGNDIGFVQVDEQGSPAPNVSSSSSSSPPVSHPPSPAPEPTPPPPTVPNTHPMQTRLKNKITKPTQKLTLLATKSPTTPTIPKTVAQAMQDPKWRNSREKSIMLKFGTIRLSWFHHHHLNTSFPRNGFIL